MPNRSLSVVTIAMALASATACAPLRRSTPPPAAALAPVVTPAPAPPPGPPELACLAHPAIDRWEQRIRTQPRHWRNTFGAVARGERYLGRIREIVEERGLPSGLALLPVIESSFQRYATGPRRSRGIWQFQAATARRFGLVVNRTRDDRLHPEPATRAAMRYLALLHARYDDWLLALAAYNCGEGRVDRALARMPGATFWELAERRHLPRITREYVPRFLAVVRVVSDLPACQTPQPRLASATE